MKLTLHAFIIQFIPLFSFGQESRSTYSYFEIENKEVVWSYIYDVEGESAELLRENMIDYLKHQIWIKKVERDADDLLVEMGDYVVSYKKYGGTYMRTPQIIRSGRWAAKARISFKEGRYRVLLYGLNYLARQSTVHHGRIKPVDTELSGTWSDFVLTDTRLQFKKSKFKALHLMHEGLKDKFTLRKATMQKNDDW